MTTQTVQPRFEKFDLNFESTKKSLNTVFYAEDTTFLTRIANVALAPIYAVGELLANVAKFVANIGIGAANTFHAVFIESKKEEPETTNFQKVKEFGTEAVLWGKTKASEARDYLASTRVWKATSPYLAKTAQAVQSGCTGIANAFTKCRSGRQA